MVQKIEGSNFSRIINVLIFIFPIVINSLQVAGDIILFILAIMGIFVAISQKLSPFVIQEIKVFSYITFGYFIAVCLSVLFSNQVYELAHFIPRDLHFLFAPFIALALYKAEINFNCLLLGCKVALLTLGIIVFQDFLIGVERPSGIMNAGVFGNLAVSIFFIAFVFFQHESLKQKIFTFASLLSGLFIIVVSGTRGAWLSFLLLSVVFIYFFYKQKTKLTKQSKFFTVLIVAVIISIIGFNQTLKDRSQLAYKEVLTFISGDYSSYYSKSPVGLRLEMYALSIEKIDDVPFFGHGYRTSNTIVFEGTTSGSYTYNHLHNAFLTNYFNGGVVLLVALLLLLFVPLKIFLTANRQNRENPLFVSGILLTIGYASFGMVNILFGDTYMNGFYVFFLAILLLLTNKSVKLSLD